MPPSPGRAARAEVDCVARQPSRTTRYRRGGERVLGHLDELEGDVLVDAVLEHPRPAPEQNGREMDRDLVDQTGSEEDRGR